MKHTLFALWFTCLLIGNVFGVELWSIGTKDSSDAEFLPLKIALEDHVPYFDKGFATVIPPGQTTGDPKLWPARFPGVNDGWAGSRQHFVTVTFDLPPNLDAATTEIRLDISGQSHPGHPPMFEVDLNETKQTLQTTAGPNMPWLTYPVYFAPGTLKATGNTLRITNVKGSWFLFDAVRCVTMKGKIETINLTPLPGILRGAEGTAPLRRIHVDFNEEALRTKAIFEIKSPTGATMVTLTPQSELRQFEIHVPVDGDSPEKEQKLTATFRRVDSPPITAECMLPLERQITMHLVHQTHLDIGFTHYQPDVLKRQVQAFRDALKYIEETKNYPEEARFSFHPEGMWAVNAFMKEATEEEKAAFIKAAKDRNIHLDAMYAQAMTGIYNDEELFELFGNAARFCREHDIVLDSVMQTDVPGYTWGLVPVMAQNGVRYMTMGPNVFHRIGRLYEPWGDKPFWWESPSGKERVLCWLLDTGYHQYHNKPMGHFLSENDVFRVLSGDDWITRDRSEPRTFLFDDLVVIRYCIEGDNGRPNRVLSDAVKVWNEKYLWPKLVISRNSDVMRILETKYGDQLPVVRGDYSPYWEDGSASTAEASAIDRRACEKIIQAQVLWSMLNSGKKLAPEFDEAWTDLIMYDEHTWGAHSSIWDPDSEFTKTQDAFKQEYARRGSREVDALFEKVIKDSPVLKKGESNDMLLINTSSRDRWGIGYIGTAPKTDLWSTGLALFKNEVGNTVPVQAIVNPDDPETCSLYADFSYGELPGPILALGTMSLVHDAAAQPSSYSGPLYINAETGEMGNNSFRLVIDKQSGAITSLQLNDVDHEFVDVGADGNRGLNDYLYIIGRDAEENRSRIEGPVKLTVVASGPLAASMLIEAAPDSTPNATTFKRQVTIFADSEKIRIENVLDKKMERKPEGTFFGFPFNIPNGKWFVDMPWASVEIDDDQLPGANRNYYSVQRYATCVGEHLGINWVTVDASQMQFAPILFNGPHDKLSAWRKEFQPGGTLYSWVCSNHWEANYKADQSGQLCFEYWVWPYVARFNNGVAQRFARQVHQPLVRIDGVAAVNPPSRWIAIENYENVLISSVRPTRDGSGAFLVRLFNPTQRPQSTVLRPPSPGQKVYRSNPLEDRLEELHEIPLAPWEVVTVRVE